jgi:SAM-dependent methyltransferase
VVVDGAVTRYDTIGGGYARLRREDPGLVAHIRRALGDADTVVNVGAGAGSYEPEDRHVIAIEPSDVMAAQRPLERAPAIRAHAEALPLRDGSVDAAMAVLSVHHWDESRERGVRELRRVARGPVVILTFDAGVSSDMWLVADYVPEIGELDRSIFPAPELLAEWLGGEATISTIPIPRDTPDWMFGAFWAPTSPPARGTSAMDSSVRSTPMTSGCASSSGGPRPPVRRPRPRRRPGPDPAPERARRRSRDTATARCGG